MKRSTKKAFQEEIELWRGIANAPAECILGEVAVRPLCNEVKKCQNCPVKEFTGLEFCLNTPLWEWKMHAIKASMRPLPENLIKVKDLAEEMQLFLATVYKHS